MNQVVHLVVIDPGVYDDFPCCKPCVELQFGGEYYEAKDPALARFLVKRIQSDISGIERLVKRLSILGSAEYELKQAQVLADSIIEKEQQACVGIVISRECVMRSPERSVFLFGVDTNGDDLATLDHRVEELISDKWKELTPSHEQKLVDTIKWTWLTAEQLNQLKNPPEVTHAS